MCKTETVTCRLDEQNGKTYVWGGKKPVQLAFISSFSHRIRVFLWRILPKSKLMGERGTKYCNMHVRGEFSVRSWGLKKRKVWEPLEKCRIFCSVELIQSSTTGGSACEDELWRIQIVITASLVLNIEAWFFFFSVVGSDVVLNWIAFN